MIGPLEEAMDDRKARHPNIKKIVSKEHRLNVYKYLAKEDHENDDMLEWEKKKGGKKVYDVVEVWNQPTLTDALKMGTTPSEALATLQIYAQRPQEEFEPEEWKRTWQIDLYNLLTLGINPKRKIIWFADRAGGMGKTDFVKGMLDRHGHNEVLFFTQFGGGRNAGPIIDKAIKRGWTGRFCLIDLPRKAEDHEIYGPIEMIKNGMFTSIMYEGATLRWKAGWVVVFANFEPRLDAMTSDRWVVKHTSYWCSKSGKYEHFNYWKWKLNGEEVPEEDPELTKAIAAYEKIERGAGDDERLESAGGLTLGKSPPQNTIVLQNTGIPVASNISHTFPWADGNVLSELYNQLTQK